MYCDAIVSVSVAYRSFVFHQSYLEGASCLPYVEGATFTSDTVDNTLHVVFVQLSFDRHQLLSEWNHPKLDSLLHSESSTFV